MTAALAQLLLDDEASAAARAALPINVQAWLEAEQRHLHPKVDRRRIDPGDDPKLDPRFLPAARGVFRLPAYWAKASTEGLASTFRRGDQALCLVHPLAQQRARSAGGLVLLATPTASVRTLLVWRPQHPDRPFFAKLSLPALLGGERRTISGETARTCVRRSKLLSAFGAGGLIPLEETLAIVREEGCLIREVPAAVSSGRTGLLPWFALSDPGSGSVEALARRHRLPVPRFIREKLFRPFLRAWLKSAIADGWTSDVHAQNLLLELDPRGLLTGRFFVRDLEDVAIDLGFVDAAHPTLRPLTRALDTREEFREPLEHSLHGHFLCGPVHALRARGVFFEELERAMGGGPARDPSAFRAWVEGRREAGLRAPPIPAKLERWLRLEQRANAQDRDPRHFAPVKLSAIPPAWRPSTQPVFRLPYLQVPVGQVEVRAGRMSPALRGALFVGRSHVRCFFHPMMAERHGLDLAEHGLGRETWWATPTASPRSVVAWRAGSPPVGLKLSLDVELLRLNRLLKSSKLERAVAVNGCFDAIPHVEVLREPVSLRLRDNAWGTIGRELAPGMNRLIPGFSIFQSQRSARFIEEKLWPPLVELFARLAFAEGLLPDLHQQNVLFDRALNGRLVLRDLDSCKTDLELRWRRGKTLAPFVRAAGTLADLKLELGSSPYDEAWGHSLRADWLWLAQQAVGHEAGRRLAQSLDTQLLAAATGWLGADVVSAELSRSCRDRLADRDGPRYSLNAMVHAWKSAQPGPSGIAADRAEFRRLAAVGRATAATASGQMTRDGPLLISWSEGRAVSFALRAR